MKQVEDIADIASNQRTVHQQAELDNIDAKCQNETSNIPFIPLYLLLHALEPVCDH